MSKVVIGCKFPSGVKLELGQPMETGYKFVNLAGANQGEIRRGGLFVPHTVNGFGRTPVDADFWAAWCNGVGLVGKVIREPGQPPVSAEQNLADQKAARKALVDSWQAEGVVFVVDDMDMAEATAADKADVRTNAEPLAESGDKRAAIVAPDVVKAA